MANRTSYYVGGLIPAAPQQNRAELYDGTAGTYTSWDAAGVQTATRPLTAAETAVLAAVDAANVTSANQATLQSRAQAALTANGTYLAIASPTVAQNTAQTQRLTKECSAVIRLLLGLLDDTSGT